MSDCPLNENAISSAAGNERPRCILSIVVIAILSAVLMVDAAHCDIVKIGVLANRGDEKCRTMWSPTAEYLSSKLPGHTFQIVPLSFEGISRAVKDEQIDFLLCNPSIYVDLEAQYGISGIATLRSKYSNVYPWFGGVIFTRADNQEIFKFPDLRGKNFMAVDETSLGGWEVALREFKKEGIDPRRDFKRLVFSSNHEAVVHAVLSGEIDAGTANSDVFADLLRDNRINLKDFRILVPQGLHIDRNDFPYPVSTRLYPNWPFAKLRKTPEELANKVAITLLSMNADNDAASSGDYKGWSYPLNYGDIRELKKELRLGIYKDFEKAYIGIFVRQRKAEIILAILIFLISLTASFVFAYLYRRSQKSESALRQSENRFSRVFHSVPAGLSISTLPDGRYIEVNDTFLRDRGYQRDELIGRSVSELNMWVDLEERTDLLNELRLDGKVPVNREVRFRTKTGDVRIMLWSAELAEFGGELSVIAISQDVTNLRQMQEALRKSEEWFRSVLDYTYSWEYWMDDDGNFLYVSPSCKRITGYRPEDFMQNKDLLHKIIHPSDEKIFRDHVHLITAHGEVVPIEFRIVAADGCEKWIGHICHSVIGADGQVHGRRVSNRDITDRKQLEQERALLNNQLLQSQKMEAIGQLASGIAHDFNNIIYAISGYSRLLFEAINQENPEREYAVEIIEAANLAAEMTRSLLAFSRKQVINVGPLDMNELLGKFYKVMPRIIGENINVNLKPAEEKVICVADANQIEQVLFNLTNNARDAMPEGGRLTFGADFMDIDEAFIKAHGYGTSGKYVVVTFSDTGCGIQKEVLGKIFEPFFTTKDPGKGTGLGLAMVYGIIKQHAGFINVYSEPEKGTTFKIYLPSEQTSEQIQIVPDEERPKGGTEAILVAEDNSSLRKLTDLILSRNGYKVVLTSDGQEAIDKFSETSETVRLVILDVIMPRKSGQEAFEEIRRIKPEIKCIFLSGHTADRIDSNIFENGNVKFIFKPVSPKVLLKQVRELLDF